MSNHNCIIGKFFYPDEDPKCLKYFNFEKKENHRRDQKNSACKIDSEIYQELSVVIFLYG